MRFGIVVLPGSNCDRDCAWALQELRFQVRMLWHRQSDLEGCKCIILPGGFSFGDYLRPGAIAKFAPILKAILKHAQRGYPVLGICNGFQILTEVGLLPGALLLNNTLRFIHKQVCLRIEKGRSPIHQKNPKNSTIQLPIAHKTGRFYAPERVLGKIESNGQVWMRYCDPAGASHKESNPNGSVHAIAGICNSKGNVFGLMPHPERAIYSYSNSEDGRLVFSSLAEAFV
ncbi:MAG: phosphoribosylformylglycinamidine synthase I [bacterium]